MSGTIPFPNGGGEETPPERRSKMDRLLDDLYEVLESPGVHSLEEIQEKLKGLNQDANIPAITQALAWVRKHSARYGWTVPHVKRGRNPEERCYFRVLAKGSFDLDAEHRTFARVGFLGTLNLVSTMSKNEVAALRLALRGIRNKAQRYMLEQILFDVESTTKKINRILKAVNGHEF